MTKNNEFFSFYLQMVENFETLFLLLYFFDSAIENIELSFIVYSCMR